LTFNVGEMGADADKASGPALRPPGGGDTMRLLQVALILANVIFGGWHLWFLTQSLQIYGLSRLAPLDLVVYAAFTAMYFVVPAIGWRLRRSLPGSVVAATIALPLLIALLSGSLWFSVR
jgi:uncharacterized BrkB/YihY/UPF0761 family membrane protein